MSDNRDEVDARMHRCDMARARPIDTSTLGPIRIEPPRTDRARERFAAEVERLGPAYRNPADSIRAGWGNIWIEAGVAALERLLRDRPAEDEQ